MCCNYAYYLRYIEKAPQKTTKKMEYGSWIHKQLELAPYNDKSIQEIVDKVNDFLKEDDDKIISKEKEFMLKIGDYKILMIADVITKNGKIIDYKATENPAYYTNLISWQIRCYSAVMHQKGLNYKPVYLLIEYKQRMKDKKEYFEPINIHSEFVPITELANIEALKQIETVFKMIDVCYENQSFPPSYNGCGRCFYKENCQYYFGY